MAIPPTACAITSRPTTFNFGEALSAVHCFMNSNDELWLACDTILTMLRVRGYHPYCLDDIQSTRACDCEAAQLASRSALSQEREDVD